MESIKPVIQRFLFLLFLILNFNITLKASVKDCKNLLQNQKSLIDASSALSEIASNYWTNVYQIMLQNQDFEDFVSSLSNTSIKLSQGEFLNSKDSEIYQAYKVIEVETLKSPLGNAISSLNYNSIKEMLSLLAHLTSSSTNIVDSASTIYFLSQQFARIPPSELNIFLMKLGTEWKTLKQIDAFDYLIKQAQIELNASAKLDPIELISATEKQVIGNEQEMINYKYLDIALKNILNHENGLKGNPSIASLGIIELKNKLAHAHKSYFDTTNYPIETHNKFQSDPYNENINKENFDVKMKIETKLSKEEVYAIRLNFTEGEIPKTGELGVFKLQGETIIEPNTNLFAAYKEAIKTLSESNLVSVKLFERIRGLSLEMLATNNGQYLATIPLRYSESKSYLVNNNSQNDSRQRIHNYIRKRFDHYGIKLVPSSKGEKIIHQNIDYKFFLAEISDQVNKMILKADTPFKVVTWLVQELLILHPFKDGNGRFARLMGQALFYHLTNRAIVFPREFHYELFYSLDELVEKLSQNLIFDFNYSFLNSSKIISPNLITLINGKEPIMVSEQDVKSDSPIIDYKFPESIWITDQKKLVLSTLPKNSHMYNQWVYFGKPIKGRQNLSQNATLDNARQAAISLMKYGRGSRSPNPHLNLRLHQHSTRTNSSNPNPSGFFGTSEKFKVSYEFAKTFPSITETNYGIIAIIDPTDADVLRLDTFNYSSLQYGEDELLFFKQIPAHRIYGVVILEFKSNYNVDQEFVELLLNPKYLDWKQKQATPN